MHSPLTACLAAHSQQHFFLCLTFCVLGIAPTYLLELFILTSACSGRQFLRSASRSDFVVSRERQRVSSTVPGTVPHLNCVFYHGICPVPSKNSLRLFRPGLCWERLLAVTLKWRYINTLDGWMDANCRYKGLS